MVMTTNIYLGAMRTRPRSMGPIGSWVPYTMSPIVMIGPTFILCYFEGTNWRCLNLLEFAPICIKFLPNIAPHTLYTLKKNFNSFQKWSSYYELNTPKSMVFWNLIWEQVWKLMLNFFLKVHFRVIFKVFVTFLFKYKRYLNNFNCYELARQEANI